MSHLNSSLLRDILAEIFFSIEDREEAKKYIVPKQGNWYNPQDGYKNKINTWIGYSIPDRESVLKAREEANEDNLPINIINELVIIDLQFVGEQAEDMVASVMHWPKRADVREAFSVVSGQIRDDKIRVVASWFKQEGMNTVYAYNVKVRVYCANVLETSANQLQHFYASGAIS